MEFRIVARRKGFLDYFKPRKKAVVKCRRTIGQILGIGGGYKTKIRCSREIAESGDIRRIIEELSMAARERGAKTPFSLPYIPDKDYRVLALGNKREMKDSGLADELRKYRKR